LWSSWLDGELCSFHFINAIAISIIYGFDVGALLACIMFL
jgi:hypothetical protein